MIYCDKLFKTIDKMNEEFIKFWIDLANIESPTEYKEGVDKAGKLFTDYAEKQGWEVEIFNQPVAGNVVCITMNTNSKEQPVTLSGHIDTVHPVGSFGNPPVRIDGDILYGPGVTDCKGGTVAALYALVALKKCGFDKRPVRLILQTDEEASSIPSNSETINYICQKSADSIAFLNCESTRGNTAVLYRRGITRYHYVITGKTIHASKCNEGASAIREAALKIAELEKYKDVNAITCNVGLISGGTAANTVPEICEFTAEFRFNTLEEMDKIDVIAKEIADKAFVDGTDCKLEKISYRCAMEKQQRNYDLLDKINAIYEVNGLPTLTARQSLGGSDAAQVTAAGIPCIDSIGVAGDYIHTVKEYALLSSLSEAAKRIAAVVYCI